MYLPIQLSCCLDAHDKRCALLILLRLPIVQMITRWYRNINLLSIAYAFRPQLMPRLILSGRAFLRIPWAFCESDSLSFFVTYYVILTFYISINALDLHQMRA